MAYRVDIARSAEGELEALYLWVIERAPQQGAAWFNGLERAVLSLDQHPERCPVASEGIDPDHLAGRLADVVDTADVGMRDLPRQPDLCTKAGSSALVGAERRETFEGDGLSELEILRAVDLAHAAATLQRDDPEAAGEQGPGPEPPLSEWSDGASRRSAGRAEAL
jgi:plasmid stabilization system protein ParE